MAANRIVLTVTINGNRQELYNVPANRANLDLVVNATTDYYLAQPDRATVESTNPRHAFNRDYFANMNIGMSNGETHCLSIGMG